MENNFIEEIVKDEERFDDEWLIWCLISVLLSFFLINYYILGTNFIIEHYQLPSIVKTINMLCATPGFLLGGVLMVSIVTGKMKALLEVIQLRNWRYYYIPEAIGLQVVFILITLAIVDLLLKPIFPEIVNFLNKNQQALKTFAIDAGWSQFVAFAIFATILAPIVEEIVFRGVIFSFFKKYTSRNVSIICTSFLFASFHLNALQFIQLFILGLIFQILFVYHKSLYPGMIYHSINNTFAVVILLLVKLGILDMP